jgi:DNA-binding MarR family transcriptional regulator
MDTIIDNPAETADAAGDAYYAQPSLQQIAQLRTHPQFADATWRMAEIPMAPLQSGRLMAFILNDRVRTQIGYFILYLHWLGRQQKMQAGVTASQVKSVFSEMKFASPGRVDALIGAMRLFGYVRIESDPYDRRLKLIVPTERHVAMLLEMLRMQFTAMAMVMEEGAIGLAGLEHDGFLAAFIRRVCESRYHGFRLVNSVPEIKSFFNIHAGTPSLLYIMINGQKTDSNPGTIVSFVSVSRLAKHLNVSRSHVRKILALAESAGFITRSGEDGARIFMLPKWLDTAERLYAAVFLHFAACIRAAMLDVKWNGNGP